MNAFADKLLPAPKSGGFRMDDYWVWCGSVIADDTGKYHMFAARWPKKLPFFDGYTVASEVVRAEADTPEGPYKYRETVLPDRGAEFWDGRMTHNPTVVKHGDQYLLFYIGGTYQGARPEPAELPTDRGLSDAERRERGFSLKPRECYASIRIGCAVADHPAGPWRRPDTPCLDVRPGKWDSSVVTNPAPVVKPDGSILLYYRSNTPDGLRIGLASSSAPNQPYARVSDTPVLQFDGGDFVEDPFVWRNDADGFEMLAKDMKGGLTGEFHAGVHLLSKDGITWHAAETPKAYSRTVLWDDGTRTTQGHFERPQLLFANPSNPHLPTHLFAATAISSEGQWDTKETWNMVIPLRSHRE